MFSLFPTSKFSLKGKENREGAHCVHDTKETPEVLWKCFTHKENFNRKTQACRRLCLKGSGSLVIKYDQEGKSRSICARECWNENRRLERKWRGKEKIGQKDRLAGIETNIYFLSELRTTGFVDQEKTDVTFKTAKHNLLLGSLFLSVFVLSHACHHLYP